MKQKCCICGREEDEYFMHRVQTSRVRWMCPECYRKAQSHAGNFLYVQRKRRLKNKGDLNGR